MGPGLSISNESKRIFAKWRARAVVSWNKLKELRDVYKQRNTEANRESIANEGNILELPSEKNEDKQQQGQRPNENTELMHTALIALLQGERDRATAETIDMILACYHDADLVLNNHFGHTCPFPRLIGTHQGSMLFCFLCHLALEPLQRFLEYLTNPPTPQALHTLLQD